MEKDKKTIKAEILKVISENPTFGKHQIFSMVVERLNVPRPIVRRVSRELRADLQNIIEVLQRDEFGSVMI